MGKKYKDIGIGDIYGRWKVVEKGKRINENTKHVKQYWKCECTCDKHTIKEVNGESLKNGSSKSCGCLLKDGSKERGLKQRKYNVKIGEKYKNWTIIADGNPKGKNTNTYICECDCVFHTRETLRADDIVNKESYGCRKCYKMNDLIGQTFGYLTVLSVNIDRSNKEGHMYYNVRCKCGTEYPVRIDYLSREFPNCGCKQSEIDDLVGKKYGELTVLSFVEKYIYENGTSVNIWECECSCGNKLNVRQGNIKSGNTISCGCEHRSRGEIIIGKLLDEWDFSYIEQYKFDDCKYKYSLPYDFVITNKDCNILCAIEFDGQFHYKEVVFPNMTQEQAKENLINTKIRDEIKNTYCKINNIPLIRIPYWIFNEKRLDSFLFDALVKIKIIEEIKSA